MSVIEEKKREALKAFLEAQKGCQCEPCKTIIELLQPSPADSEVDAAAERLQKHNEWRRGAETEMCSPKQLGEDIELIIRAAASQRGK